MLLRASGEDSSGDTAGQLCDNDKVLESSGLNSGKLLKQVAELPAAYT